MPVSTADAVLRRGDKGLAIRSLQERLNAHGAKSADGKSLDVDGEFGARTEEALKAFQRSIRETPDGVADKPIIVALAKSPPSKSSPPAGPAPLNPLFADVYRLDTDGAKRSDWDALAAKGLPWAGGIVKATQGTSYPLDWLRKVWPMVRDAGGDRYGDTWFRGAYAFLNLTQNGVKQAEFFLRAIEGAGGWGEGDLWPILDVELGNDGKNGKPKGANWAASRSQIIDCTTSAAEYIRARTGRDVCLYANGALRDKGITSHMGCRYLWLPRYTVDVPRKIYARAGWSKDEFVLWQYNEPGSSKRPGYPKNAGAFLDDSQTSSLEHPGGLAWLREAIKPAA